MNSALAYSRPGAQRAINQYNQNSILNATPEELILKLYDLCLVCISKKDVKKASLVIAELIASLNFDFHDEAMGLFRLYRFCQDCLFKEEYEDALSIMKELRETWAQAFDLR